MCRTLCETWRGFHDCVQEYRRAAHVLKGLGGAKTLFLRSYATYLAGEKRKDEERLEAAGPLGKSDAPNRVSAVLLGCNHFLATRSERSIPS